jgi:hypothetical protein
MVSIAMPFNCNHFHVAARILELRAQDTESAIAILSSCTKTLTSDTGQGKSHQLHVMSHFIGKIPESIHAESSIIQVITVPRTKPNSVKSTQSDPVDIIRS